MTPLNALMACLSPSSLSSLGCAAAAPPGRVLTASRLLDRGALCYGNHRTKSRWGKWVNAMSKWCNYQVRARIYLRSLTHLPR
ncbi:BZ3500_MvSof-1268-A1-R1_Chr1-3g01548 [Microbotryum saponariae]|uniref:BZ3500_MvSof-1268-A1-R1_Chr1-3g01548 protein n=1 Tax=Microbotryum saponariae TaxID=289078 RepID=A0A2X0M646_9BASI|nr:BZ3500_MvSof-1268-A1-R1_Chr1-3g01548 [Microbotryum saponariae]SCZ94002.1 BZ3501_MvSof-1269-A2-R1_Chr1-3g01150 [Microbotryum saponariae]